MDQSNLFGSDPSVQYKPIWAIGGAWKISEEEFMSSQSWLNDLSLRASYGLAGNSPDPGLGGKYDILNAGTSPGFETPGYVIITPGNDKLTWEKTRTVNVGFDTRFIDNRISLSMDYYHKKTTDLLGYIALNPTSGWPFTLVNLGAMTNEGFEISLNTHNIKGKDFNWYTTFTFSHNKNEITKLEVETPYTFSSMPREGNYVEGYSANSLFAYRYAGLDSNGNPQVYDKEGNVVAGIDSPMLSTDDVAYMGTTVPKFYGGLGNRFTYKSLELSFLFVYNLGHVMRKDANTFWGGRPTGNFHNDFDKRWRNPGDEAFTNVPKYSAIPDPDNRTSLYYYADCNVLNASYIKLRDLALSWNVDPQICRKIYLEGVKLTFHISNLFYWAANNEGIDPEAYNLSLFTNNRRDKYGPTYSIGLTVNF
jgi:outer membrane receptor protein involved in Fe transport